MLWRRGKRLGESSELIDNIGQSRAIAIAERSLEHTKSVLSSGRMESKGVQACSTSGIAEDALGLTEVGY